MSFALAKAIAICVIVMAVSVTAQTVQDSLDSIAGAQQDLVRSQVDIMSAVDTVARSLGAIPHDVECTCVLTSSSGGGRHCAIVSAMGTMLYNTSVLPPSARLLISSHVSHLPNASGLARVQSVTGYLVIRRAVGMLLTHDQEAFWSRIVATSDGACALYVPNGPSDAQIAALPQYFAGMTFTPTENEHPSLFTMSIP